MDMPSTNKKHQDLNEQFGENAVLLEESLKTVDWKFFIKLYFAGLGLLLITIFGIIVIIKAALAIF